MFDLNDEKHTTHKPGTPEGRMVVNADLDEDKPEDKEAEAERERKEALHTRLMGYYRTEMARQESNRMEQALDANYYDHIQWTDEEIAVLRERGQAPIVYNVLANTVNWVIGSEKRGRTDFKVLPRGKEDSKPAEAKTKFMKYLSDVNRTPFHRSRAFEDTVKVGIGWLETYVDEDSDTEIIKTRYESWRNMLWDSAATEMDGTDGRYQFRSKFTDEDVAVMLANGDKETVARAVSDSSTYASSDLMDGDLVMDSLENSLSEATSLGSIEMIKRRRVRLIEAWYTAPANVKVLRGGPLSGEDYDEQDAEHVAAVQSGQSKVISKGRMEMRVALMTTKDILYDGKSPFKHNRFKFIPIWGYRRDHDNLPYGLIRGIRPIQDAVNKRASKALHILSTNKILMEEGAAPDGMSRDEFAEEANRPDGVIEYRKGYKLELNADRNLGAEHMNQMSVDVNMIQQVGGVTDENLGHSTNAASGKAILARQEQGSITTNKLFDNLRLAVQMEGEIELSLMEQYITEEKQFRITNMRGVPEFITVNDGLPENDIARTKADFVISESDWRASMRQAQTEALTELMMKLPPEVVLLMLDLVVDGMDIENREEIVKRLRSHNGQKDPDQTEPTPEEIAAAQQAQKQQQFMEEQAMVALDGEKAKNEKVRAETARIAKQSINDSMTATNTALTAAQMVVAVPTIAAVGDSLLAQAGWKGAHIAAGGIGQMPTMPPQQIQQQAPMQDPAQMQPEQQPMPIPA